MLYHLNQIQMAYNTNRIEGSRLTEEQTRYLYETRTVMCDALVDNAIGSLLAATPSKMTFEDICDFHYRFELIHPFQDGNGRVGRLVMFGQCLANGIMPFIVTDAEKAFYYRGLAEYAHIPGFLRDTLRHFQDLYYYRYVGYLPDPDGRQGQG